jgi:uncharacterized protein
MRSSELDLIFVSDGGAPTDHWQSRWRAKLSSARRVETGNSPPTPEDIVAAAARARQPILFIGHSVGAIAIAQAAESLRGADVRGAFLVAPPGEETLLGLHGGRVGPTPRARLPWRSVLVASRTDPWAPFAQSLALAANWGSHFVDAGESGRIDAESGHGPWPDGLLRLAAFLKGI